MCIYMYIYAYICINVCIYMCVYVLYMCTCVHVYIVYIGTCVCVYMCTYMCMCICICICIYIAEVIHSRSNQASNRNPKKLTLSPSLTLVTTPCSRPTFAYAVILIDVALRFFVGLSMHTLNSTSSPVNGSMPLGSSMSSPSNGNFSSFCVTSPESLVTAGTATIPPRISFLSSRLSKAPFLLLFCVRSSFSTIPLTLPSSIIVNVTVPLGRILMFCATFRFSLSTSTLRNGQPQRHIQEDRRTVAVSHT